MSGHTQGTPRWIPTSDGRRLYAMELPGPEGSGPATVVFEAGAAASRSTWALVQPPAAGHARAVVYDRSGLGRSAPDPAGRTLARMADDLNQVLDQLGPGPFVLAGHSAGGPIARLAAARRPDRIAGVVLVDATDEGAGTLFTPRFRRLEHAFLAVMSVLARLRLLRFLFGWLLRAMPGDVRADLVREGFTPQVVRTQREQSRTFLDELAAWQAEPPDLGDIPVVAVSGGRADGGMSAANRAEINAAHARRADLSPGGRHVVAARSGHYVPITEPGLVVDEIARLLDGGGSR